MNATELAHAMLEWEKLTRQANELASQIEEAVLKIGKTQTVGNVRATYSKGRKTYDYETAAVEHPMVSESTIKLFTTPKVDWRGICNHAGIDEIPVLKETEPTVRLKVLE